MRGSTFPLIDNLRPVPTTQMLKQIFRAFSSPANYIGMIRGRPPTAMSVTFLGHLMALPLLPMSPFQGKAQKPVLAEARPITPALPHTP